MISISWWENITLDCEWRRDKFQFSCLYRSRVDLIQVELDGEKVELDHWSNAKNSWYSYHALDFLEYIIPLL